MPNPVLLTPRTFALILIASAGKEVGSFMLQIPEQLIVEAQNRATNLAIQYGTIAIGQVAIGQSIDPAAPARLFMQGIESLSTASSPMEAASRGTIAASVLILSSLSSQDPNVSLTFGGFLLLLAQNVLLPGSQIVFVQGLVKLYIIGNILMRIITEIQVEILRRKLKLPYKKFKFKIFKKQRRKDFVFKYIRFKKRKIKFLFLNIPLFLPYEKELIIKQARMVEPIPVY